MADASDLKSDGLNGREGSNPSPGTKVTRGKSAAVG